MKKQIWIIYFLIFFSCTRENKIDDLMKFKTLPEKVKFTEQEKSQLQSYAKKIKSMKMSKVESKLDANEKAEFARQIVNLRKQYNRCIDLLNEIEKSSDNVKSDQGLRNCLDQLEVIMKYVFINYKL